MAEVAEKTEVVEESKHCTGCKKIMSPARKYYRNGAYYCNKNCYKKKAAEDAAKAKEDEIRRSFFDYLQLIHPAKNPIRPDKSLRNGIFRPTQHVRCTQ